MRPLVILGAVAMCVSGTEAFAAPPDSEHSLFSTSAVVESGSREDDGSLWFRTWDDGVRFVLPKLEGESGERLWTMLVDSSSQGRSITIGFDAAGASYNADQGLIDFPLCSVRMDDIVFTRSPACIDKPIAAAERPAATKVALAWAEVGGGSPTRAVALVGSAIAGASLPDPLKAIALMARSSANEIIAYDAPPQSPEGDRALITALDDNRRLAELQPRNVEHRFSQAYDLVGLGDYDAAAKLYDEILKLWPDETYRVTIRRAALARLEGQPQRSLDLLNTLIPDNAPEDLGMKFYYHRGWTLMKLDRFEEAIADLTAGMKSQPDYSWSYILRGCSYASVGQLDYAAGDFNVAASFLEALPAVGSNARVQQDIALARSTAQSLKQKASSGDTAPVKDLCDRFWSNFDKSRPRSRLLDEAAAPAPQITSKD